MAKVTNKTTDTDNDVIRAIAAHLNATNTQPSVKFAGVPVLNNANPMSVYAFDWDRTGHIGAGSWSTSQSTGQSTGQEKAQFPAPRSPVLPIGYPRRRAPLGGLRLSPTGTRIQGLYSAEQEAAAIQRQIDQETITARYIKHLEDMASKKASQKKDLEEGKNMTTESNQIVSLLLSQNLHAAKKLISETLNKKLGVLMEEKLIAFGPTIHSVTLTEQGTPEEEETYERFMKETELNTPTVKQYWSSMPDERPTKFQSGSMIFANPEKVEGPEHTWLDSLKNFVGGAVAGTGVQIARHMPGWKAKLFGGALAAVGAGTVGYGAAGDIGRRRASAAAADIRGFDVRANISDPQNMSLNPTYGEKLSLLDKPVADPRWYRYIPQLGQTSIEVAAGWWPGGSATGKLFDNQQTQRAVRNALKHIGPNPDPSVLASLTGALERSNVMNSPFIAGSKGSQQKIIDKAARSQRVLRDYRRAVALQRVGQKTPEVPGFQAITTGNPVSDVGVHGLRKLFKHAPEVAGPVVGTVAAAFPTGVADMAEDDRQMAIEREGLDTLKYTPVSVNTLKNIRDTYNRMAEVHHGQGKRTPTFPMIEVDQATGGLVWNGQKLLASKWKEIQDRATEFTQTGQ